MWTTQINDAGCPGRLRAVLHRAGDAAVYADVIEAWRSDAQFRSWFNSLLAGVSFRAFRWETPSVSAKTVTQPFEFVLLDSPDLVRQPDPSAFNDRFRNNVDAEVLTFANLGGDAIMVVPRPIGPDSAYGHLGTFVRNAPESQRDALWQAVGEAMINRLGEKPVWLSTAGGGVSWLHVRLDDRPKYYGFAPYRQVK
jgi:uncharacterized protein DUF6940